jgi:hypothetical protein
VEQGQAGRTEGTVQGRLRELALSFGIDSKLQLNVPPGQTVTKTASFPMGELKVTAPKGTKVFRGSELLGVAPLKPVPLAAGKHTLGLMDPGGKFSNRTVTVPPQGAVELSL